MTENELINLMKDDIFNWDKIISPEILEEDLNTNFCILKQYPNEWYPFTKRSLSKDFDYGISIGDVVIKTKGDTEYDIVNVRWLVFNYPPTKYESIIRFPKDSEEFDSIVHSVFGIGSRACLVHIDEKGNIDMNFYDFVDIKQSKYIKVARNTAEEIAYQRYIVNKEPIDYIFTAW